VRLKAFRYAAGEQRVAIGRLTHGAGRHRAILAHVVPLEKGAEMAESLYCPGDGRAVEPSVGENSMTEAYGPALAGQGMYFCGAGDTSDQRPNAI